MKDIYVKSPIPHPWQYGKYFFEMTSSVSRVAALKMDRALKLDLFYINDVIKAAHAQFGSASAAFSFHAFFTFSDHMQVTFTMKVVKIKEKYRFDIKYLRKLALGKAVVVKQSM